MRDPGKAAKAAGISVRELLNKLRVHDIPLNYDMEQLKYDLRVVSNLESWWESEFKVVLDTSVFAALYITGRLESLNALSNEVLTLEHAAGVEG